MTTKVFIVDDHPIVRQMLVKLIQRQSDLSFCGEATTVQTALEKIPECQPDLVLIDLSLPNGYGIDLVKMLQARWPDLKSLVVSGYEEAAFSQQALAAGARGYVVKGDVVALLEAMRLVMAGEIYQGSKSSE